MSKKIEWKEKKTSLGNAIIIGAVLAIVGVIIGANWNGWFSQYSGFLGFDSGQSADWSQLNEVYDKLKSTYNGEIDTKELVEGAKKGMVEAIGDAYTLYMDADESKDFYNSLHGNVCRYSKQ